MNLNSTINTRVLLFTVFLFSFTHLALGQTTGINYTYSWANNGWVANGGTIFTGSAGTDEAVYTITPTAFTWPNGFYYGSQFYPSTTTIYVSTNGWMSFINQGGSLPNNNLTSTPGIIAPLWDDLKVAAAGNINWKITGGATTRRLIVEWNQMLWDHNATIQALSFQVTLYDAGNSTPNVIDFKFLNNGTGTTNINNGSGGASSGLSGFCTGDFYSYQFPPGAGAPLKTSEVNSLNSHPVASQISKHTPTVHPNDECATAEPMTFNPSLPLNSILGTTLHSTQSAISLPGCGGLSSTNDVWVTFTKPSGITNFEIFTDSVDCRGAATHAVGMEVYTACGGAAISCNLGGTGPASTNATSYLNLTGQPCASQDYWIRIYSKDAAYRGYFRFNIRPPGRDCNYANDISGCCSSASFSYTSPAGLSACGFENNVDSNAACGSLSQRGEDYVFKFTPCATMCATLSLTGTTAGANPGMFLYANSPCGGGAVCRGNISTSGGGTLTFANTILVAGITYYIVIDNDSGGATPCLNNWALTINGAIPTPASYDNCAAPVNITVAVASGCVGATDYTNSCATPSPVGAGYPLPCGGVSTFSDGITPDVWFTFTSLTTQPHQINVSPGTAPAAQDLSMAVYTGSCGAFTQVPGACDDNSNGLMPSLSIVPSAAGVVYWVRIWSNNGTKAGNFRICVIQGCTPPNDLCTGVVTLTVGQPTIGDNGCSTGTGEPFSGVGASCWTNSGGAGQLNTVWYNFVATNSQMRMRIRLLTLFDSQMVLYSSTGVGANTCSGSFNPIFCNDNGPNTCGSGGTIRWSEITATGLTVGNTYFLRVDGYNANTGSFELTVVQGTDPFPPINTQDCALPQSICSGSNMTVADPGFQGTGNVCDMANGGTTCMAAGERGSAWYTWTVTGAPVVGTYMNFLITPNSPNDYDFIIYVVDTTSMMNGNPGGDGIPAVANYCNSLTNASAYPAVACNWSACGNTGCNQSAGTVNIPGGNFQGGAGAACVIPAILVPPGMTATFLLQVSNYTTSTSGFTLNFQGTPINSTPPSMMWNGAAGTTVWQTVTNWSPNNCSPVPDCSNLIPAIIGTGPFQPTITSNRNVKDLTINPGATLTIAPAITLSVCGNFTNNGTLSCGAGANVTFIGTTAQTINGTFAAASNQFYNLVVNKSGGTLTFNTNIYCQGNLTVTAGVVNVNNKNIEIGGNFYNVNGNTSLTGLGAGVGGSTISFTRRSAVNQLFQNDGANLTLNNVSMRQLVAGGTLTLNANATSDLIIGPFGTLSMGTGGFGQEGVIVTPAGTTREVNVTNGAAAACNAGSASSYVSGKLRRTIATAANSYDFPVGLLGTGYERANINYNVAPSAGYSLLAQFKTWGGANCVFPAGNGPAAAECITATYNTLPYFNHGYWNIDASIVGPTGTYTATMYNTAMSNNTGMGWTVVKAVSGSCAFALAGNCNAASTAGATIRNGLTGFSDFTTVQSQTPLPIELLSFDAKPNQLGVLCSWVTATETNNDHFELERSKTGISFAKIGTMRGYGPGTSVHNMDYKFQDEDVCTGTVYYRLKQVDIDGRFTYSEIVAVSCKNSLLSIAPNPASSSLKLNFFESQAGNISVEVTDLLGQVVLTKSYVVEKGFNDRNIDISILSNGVYYLKLVSAGAENDQVARQIKFLKY